MYQNNIYISQKANNNVITALLDIILGLIRGQLVTGNIIDRYENWDTKNNIGNYG